MEKPEGEKHFGDEYAGRTRHREKENERDEIETIFLVEGDYGYITMRRRGVVDAPKHSPFFFLFPSASVSSASCWKCMYIVDQTGRLSSFYRMGEHLSAYS